MNKFKTLFGIDIEAVKEDCVLAPLVNRDLLSAFGITNLKRGNLYGSATCDNFTFFHAGMHAGLVGDLVLYLNETKASRLFLFGSCGSVGRLGIGAIVSSSVVYSCESFSDFLFGKQTQQPGFEPDPLLYENFCKRSEAIRVVCKTVPSLKLEEEYLGALCKEGVDVVDMEASAFFSAASFIKRSAVSVFYVNDVIVKKPFYEQKSWQEKKIITASIEKAAGYLRAFISERS